MGIKEKGKKADEMPQRYFLSEFLIRYQPETMATEGGGDEIEVVDIVRREGNEDFSGLLGEEKVWVDDGVVPQPSFELSLLEASENRLAGPESDVEAEYDAGVSEPPEARSLTEVALSLEQLSFNADNFEGPGSDLILKDLI